MLIRMHKAEKYAVDMRMLDENTKTFFLRNFGCSRKVYNLYVDFLYSELEKAGYKPGSPLPAISIPEVTVFKKEYSYLKEADSLGLANAKISFHDAMKRYNEVYDHVTYTKRALRRDRSGEEPLTFRGLKGMPKFHAKAMGDFSYTTNCQYPAESNNLKKPTVRLEGSILFLPKLKQGVRLVLHRPIPSDAVIGNVTVSMDTDGSIYAAIEYGYRLDMDMRIRDAAVAGDSSIINRLEFLGLDYSQPHFYVDSEGRKANYPHFYRKSEEKLARLQRELSHMVNGSKNYGKKQAEIKALHRKIRNQRRDFICKEAAYLASGYDVVAVEDIDLRSMSQGLKLAKNLYDNGFGMFRERLAKKLEEKGSVLVKVDRFYASTKTCSCCGYKNSEVTLGVDEWDCPECGTHHYRDDNAAVNIREEAKRIFIEYFAGWLEEDETARKRAASLLAGRKKKNSKQKTA